MDFYVSMGASLILTAVKALIKNDSHRATYRAVMLKIANAILDCYADDSAFPQPILPKTESK